MRQNGIARVVFLSSIGAEKRHGAGFVDGLARIEQRLDAAREQTGTALLHLRCGYFMTNLLTDLDGLRAGRLTTTRLLDDPMPWVDPRDIATVATLRLLAGDWTGRQVQAVHGPAGLTWTEREPGGHPQPLHRSWPPTRDLTYLVLHGRCFHLALENHFVLVIVGPSLLAEVAGHVDSRSMNPPAVGLESSHAGCRAVVSSATPAGKASSSAHPLP